MNFSWIILGLFLCLTGPLSMPARAATVRVAVASNFLPAARALAKLFKARSGHDVLLSPGASGRLYAQIRNGAPFDVFLSAGARRPRKLQELGLAMAGTRFTYALGRLVLWSPRPGRVDPAGKILSRGGFSRLAMANPRLAPYGRAARETLVALGLWRKLEDRIVLGENVGQTLQFVRAGAAPLGLVSASLAAGLGGSLWPVPASLHAPIRQQAVLIHDTAAARAFLAFLRCRAARRKIAAFGYGVPR